MRKLMIGLALLAVGTPPNPLLAQNLFSQPFGGELKRVIDQGVGSYDIAPSERTDLSGCKGADEAGVMRAIETCWPVLETYRLLSKLGSSMDDWRALPPEQRKSDTPQSKLVATIASDILKRAVDRNYPAEDIARIASLFSRAEIASARDDGDEVYRNMVGAHIIVTISRIQALRTSELARMLERFGPPVTE